MINLALWQTFDPSFNQENPNCKTTQICLMWPISSLTNFWSMLQRKNANCKITQIYLCKTLSICPYATSIPKRGSLWKPKWFNFDPKIKCETESGMYRKARNLPAISNLFLFFPSNISAGCNPEMNNDVSKRKNSQKLDPLYFTCQLLFEISWLGVFHQ